MYLREFELSPFMIFAERMGYNVRGRANGAASIKAALDRGEITADLKIDSMTVNATGVAPLHILSRWDLEQQRILVEMNNARTDDNIIQGYYDPTTKRYYADGNFQNLPLSMLDPMLTTVVSQTGSSLEAASDSMFASASGKESFVGRPATQNSM